MRGSKQTRRTRRFIIMEKWRRGRGECRLSLIVRSVSKCGWVGGRGGLTGLGGGGGGSEKCLPS